MSNNLTKHDLTDRIIRPKRLYLTSEDIEDFNSSASCRFTMTESISAEEGFRLVYGLKSFGYLATANNFSERQQNNRLNLVLNYLEPQYLWNSTTSHFDINHHAGARRAQAFSFVIPDGFYPTLDDLFQVLNDPKINQIPSGIKYDVIVTADRHSQRVTDPNNIPLLLIWSVEKYGFSISTQLGLGYEIKNDYRAGGLVLQAHEVNPVLESLEIVPGDNDTNKLYNFLFTNLNSEENMPANVPASLPFKGSNPPEEVIVDLTAPLSYVNAIINPVDFVDPMEDFFYHWHFEHTPTLDTTFLKDEPNPSVVFPCYALGYRNLPLQIWYTPRLAPLYVEIDTSLETHNLTVDGYASNLLFRHFPLGADNGARSFFQSWDQPVFHHMRSARNQIDSIKIDFVCESNKWDFYNLNFFIEILIYEAPDEEELLTFDEQNFVVPGEDPMTAGLQQYSNKFSDPFPIQTTSGHQGVLRLGSSRSGELKKRRR